MVTIKEIARIVNVSSATVSRVINNAHNVSPDIRERVQQVIRDSNYFPNHAARSLVRRRVGSIAVLIHNIHHSFYQSLLQGFVTSAARSGRTILFCNLEKEQECRDRYIQYLTNGFSDGLILYGNFFTDQPSIEHLRRVHFPFLLIENNYDYPGVNQILINNLDGAKNALEYLVKRGHRRIAMFMDDINKKVNTDRLNGYIQVMRKYGLSIGQEDIRHIYSSRTPVIEEIRKMMELPESSRPTAVFTVNDRLATEVIMAVRKLGCSVPQDLSVMGFDNQVLFENGYNGPKITSIKQPLFEIGRDSIEIMTGILDGQFELPFTRTYETELIEGETVGSREGYPL